MKWEDVQVTIDNGTIDKDGMMLMIQSCLSDPNAQELTFEEFKDFINKVNDYVLEFGPEEIDYEGDDGITIVKPEDMEKFQANLAASRSSLPVSSSSSAVGKPMKMSDIVQIKEEDDTIDEADGEAIYKQLKGQVRKTYY